MYLNLRVRPILVAFALALGLGLGLVASTATAADDAAKGSADLKKFQGDWTAPSAGGGEVVYTFKDNKLTVKAPTRTYQITVTLDDSTKPHKTIDFKVDEGPEDAKGKTSKAIYKFDGDDTAVLCLRPEGDRPDKFEQVGEEQFVINLKRKASK